MTERIPKSVLVVCAALAPFFLAILAYSRPEYFTSQMYLGGLIVLEFLFAAVWMYRQTFFPIVVMIFLFAGTGEPGPWAAGRWLFLGVGAFVGCLIMIKERGYNFGLFHEFALVAVMAAAASAAGSYDPQVAFFKTASLLLLFVYGGTGARLAVAGRENRFFRGFLTGCELLVGLIAAFHFWGIEAMGSPNSLGAVVGVVGLPILLWGMLLDEKPVVRWRRLLMFAVCVYLLFQSQARAGMAAAAVSCGLLCFGLRKYKLLAQGTSILLIVIATTAIVQPEVFSKTVSSTTDSIVYKGKDPTRGLFASRESPWQQAVDRIRVNFWFGTGFGTAKSGYQASERSSQFSTNQEGVENGSSYLEITAWVGVLGVIPFLLLLIALFGKTLNTFMWMWKTGNAAHPAVPLATVVIAGLVHAAFEDWLFAPGYYLTVFFWSLAFVLVDIAPSLSLPKAWFGLSLKPTPQDLGGAAQSR